MSPILGHEMQPTPTALSSGTAEMAGKATARWEFGPFVLDEKEFQLLRDGEPVHLTPKAFGLLTFLVKSQGHVVTKEDLFRAVWQGTHVEETNLIVTMSALRRALGDNTGTPQFIATVARKGYRFIHLARNLGGVPNAGPGPSHSLAVLPFRNVGSDPDLEYLSDGLTESILGRVAQVQGLRVIARSTVSRYKGKTVDVERLGRTLGVGAVLTGSLQRYRRRFIADVELIGLPGSARLWGARYERAPSGFLGLQDEIASRVVEEMGSSLSGADRRRLSKQHTGSPEAYDLFLKGRYFWEKRTPESMKKGLEFLSLAVEKDPQYALAHAVLALAHGNMAWVMNGFVPSREARAKAEAAASRALEIDDELVEAHVANGWIRFFLYWDVKGGEAGYRRALELDPNNVSTLHLYGLFLALRLRFDEAVGAMKRALSVDPMSPTLNADLALPLMYGRRYDEAEVQARRALELEPHSAAGHRALGTVYQVQGRHPEAIHEFEQTLRLGGPSTALQAILAHSQARSGKKKKAKERLDELLHRRNTGFVPAFHIAFIHFGFGDNDRTFEWLETAFREHCTGLVTLPAFPGFDPLRLDPRFDDLMKRMWPGERR